MAKLLLLLSCLPYALAQNDGLTTDFDNGLSTYQGCYPPDDSGSLPLSGPFEADREDRTDQNCKTFCSTVTEATPSAPYVYFGIFRGRDCICGDVITSTPETSDANCYTPNSGDPTQRGGSDSHLSIWLNRQSTPSEDGTPPGDQTPIDQTPPVEDTTPPGDETPPVDNNLPPADENTDGTPPVETPPVETPPVETPTPNGPTTTPENGQFLGCFVNSDGTQNLLDGPSADFGSTLTQEACGDFCQTGDPTQQFPFFGIEAGTTCHCGTFTNYEAVAAPETECDAICPGPEQCGGTNRLSLFQYDENANPPVETPPAETPPVETPPVETPPVETPIAGPTQIDTPNGSYAGCYEDIDGSGTPLFNGPSLIGQTDLTLESCQVFCQSEATGAPFQFFGLEAGTNCRCGTAFQHDAFPLDSTTNNQCNAGCSGAPTQQCGGINRISVYNNNEYAALPEQQPPPEETPTVPGETPAPPGNEPIGEPTPVLPTATRLPLPFPNRPPSSPGDGVDYPYFNYDPYAPRPRPQPVPRPPYGGKPQKPQKPAAKPQPWKPKPTIRPWYSGNGRGYPVAARNERRWFGLW